MSLVSLVSVIALAGCGAPPARAPEPVPATEPARAPQPVPATETARAATREPTAPASPTSPAVNTSVVRTIDSARVAARLVSRVVADNVAPSRREVVRGRAAPLGPRTDTIPVRTLSAPVRVCAGGDVTLGTNLDRAWAREASAKMREQFGLGDSPAELLAPLKRLIGGADVVLLNVESAIGSGRAPSKCGRRSTNCFAFRAPVASAAALRAVAPKRVVVGNVANNHARDAGDEGRDTTVAILERAGVLVTGDDTLATPVPTPAGDTIGVLGFYTSTDTPDARDTAAVRRHIARAAARYPVVIATMHLGAEGYGAQRTRDVNERFLRIDRGNPVAFADAAVRGGAALIVGHGPHVLRAMEWREHGALIAYSLGNLLTYGPFGLKEPMNRGGVLCATIDRKGRVESASLTPTLQLAPGVLSPDSTFRAAALVDSLGRLDFRATGARVDSTGVIRPRTQPR